LIAGNCEKNSLNSSNNAAEKKTGKHRPEALHFFPIVRVQTE